MLGINRVTVSYMTMALNLAESNLQLRETLELVGTPWTIATNSEVVLRSLHRWKAPEPADKPFTLRVLVDDQMRRTGESPVYRGMGHVVFATFGSDFFGFDLLRKEITAAVSSETASDENFWNHVLLPIAIGVMGCFIGVVPLHSACVEWDGIGVLIAGLSGAGKSTLSAAMANAGFSVLSDDWTYLSVRSGNLVACGLGIPFKLLPDAARFFGGLPHHQIAPSMNGELAYQVDLDHFASRSIKQSVPRHLFMLERRPSGPSDFRRMSPHSVQDFFEQSSEPFPKVLSHGHKFRSQILSQVANLQCWQFTYSGSPHDAAASIRRFIQQ